MSTKNVNDIAKNASYERELFYLEGFLAGSALTRQYKRYPDGWRSQAPFYGIGLKHLTLSLTADQQNAERNETASAVQQAFTGKIRGFRDLTKVRYLYSYRAMAPKVLQMDCPFGQLLATYDSSNPLPAELAENTPVRVAVTASLSSEGKLYLELKYICAFGSQIIAGADTAVAMASRAMAV